MATTIRLKRVGKKGMPYYRIVVVDSRKPRDGSTIETLGIYQPLEQPAKITIDEEKALLWLKKGARPSATVRSILTRQGILAKLASEKQAARTSAKAR
jgi:small subunit ribosomal protein S16